MIKKSKMLSLLLVAICLTFIGCGGETPATDQAAQAEQVSYESATVSYLGPEGTYTQEACGVFFEGQGKYVPYETAEAAAEAMAGGETDYAVIPQENTIGGAVLDNVDTLIAETGVSVVGEVELPIQQNLLALPEASFEDIKKVYSHPQGLTQGSAWLKEHLPDAELIEVTSTAEGAKKVAEGGDKSCASIGSAACEDVYGLVTLAPGIQENDSNVTRFYILSKDEAKKDAGSRLAFIASGSAEDLPLLMEKIEEQEMDLVTIHDRPQKTTLGQYIYLIECEDCSYEEYEKLTEDGTFEFRYLGSFEVK